jgi:glyoxylase-like metal-dependent hydrolase (beta-lactamase superfamily II)
VLGDEMARLADDLRELGQPVVAGFSTHPHWDHLLWHARLGTAPRYGTARCAAADRDQLSDPHAKVRIAELLIPPDIADQVPLDLLGLITGLPRRDGADSLGRPSRPDYRASSACPRAMRHC